MGIEEREEDARIKKIQAASCSCCTLILGVITIVISCWGLSSEPVWVIDRLLFYNIAYDFEGGFPLMTTRACMRVLLAGSIVLVLAMFLSFVGSLCRSKCLMSVGTLLAFAFALWMFSSAVFMLSRYEMVTPIIDRQVEFLCNSTVYERLSTNMNCSWASSVSKPECAEVCIDRVNALIKYQGCEFLPKLCTPERDISTRWWNHVTQLSIFVIITATVLTVTTIVSCCFTYIMNFNRRGKPTAENLCWLMLCPCCIGDAGKGFTTYDEDDRSDEEVE
jgi:hypothetical protein